MSQKLAQILDQPERLVAKAVDKLEGLNGYPSEDARLLAENSQAVRSKIADLGLDPDDTTGEELYQALLAKFARDNALIDKAVGVKPDSDLSERLDKATQLAGHMAEGSQAWFLKHSAAKQLLRAQPPRKLMKKLSYRSVESMLKREDITSVYLSLPSVESPSWQKTFAKAAAKLDSGDYEMRSPTLAQISGQNWSVGQGPRVVSNSLIGAVGLRQSAKLQNAGVLTLAILLVDGLKNLSHAAVSPSLGSLHPALVWWEQAKNLMAFCGQDVVSLNLKDVANNHLAQAAYAKRSAKHGRESIWNELASRYHNQEAQLEVSLVSLENSASQEVKKITRRQPKTLAVEYAEAIANEF